MVSHYIAAPSHRLDVVLAARCIGELFAELADENSVHVVVLPPVDAPEAAGVKDKPTHIFFDRGNYRW